MNDILLIGNNIEFLDSIKGYLNKSFSMKDLSEAAYILSIKIYRDRSRRLISFFNEYIQSKKEFLPVLQGVKLSQTQSPTTAEDRKRMKVIPYTSVIGSIKYAMMCTRLIVYLTMSLERGYNSDPEVDHWTSVQIIFKED